MSQEDVREMSQEDVLEVEGNALLKCRNQQNEREAQHHDESTSTFYISKKIYKIALAILVGFIVVVTSSASGVIQFYQTEENSRLDRRTVSKLFYQAVAIDLSGGDTEDINRKLNKMYGFDYDRLVRLHNPNFLQMAKEMKAYRVVEGINSRNELLKDREAFEAIQRLSEAVKRNPVAWEDFVSNHK